MNPNSKSLAVPVEMMDLARYAAIARRRRVNDTHTRGETTLTFSTPSSKKK